MFSQTKDIKHNEPDFHSAGGSKMYFFPNMVMWHIKLKGMMSIEQDTNKIFNIGSNW